jgi:hypothetical protein
MSDLTARIKAFHSVVREALHRELSMEEQAELAAIIEILRSLVADQELSLTAGNRVSSPHRGHQCGAQSVRTGWRNAGRKS